MAVSQTTKPKRVVEATDARSGRPGVHILWILIASTGLVAIGFAILLAVQGAPLGGQGGMTKLDHPSITQTPSPVKATPAG